VVLRQVVLSFGIPFALVPLVVLTSKTGSWAARITQPTVLARKLQAYLRWRNAHARHPDVPAAVRGERHKRLGAPKPKPPDEVLHVGPGDFGEPQLQRRPRPGRVTVETVLNLRRRVRRTGSVDDWQ
jgi:hypothetical protein